MAGGHRALFDGEAVAGRLDVAAHEQEVSDEGRCRPGAPVDGLADKIKQRRDQAGGSKASHYCLVENAA
mgnify:CR=1 FL=1